MILLGCPQALFLSIGLPDINGAVNILGAYRLRLATPTKHPVMDETRIVQCYEAAFVLGG